MTPDVTTTADDDDAGARRARLARPGQAVISVSGLSKRYGLTRVLDDVSFEVARGEIFGLLGSNGTGKTTTVECLQGLRRYDGGTLRVLGLDPRTDATALRRRIGSQLQQSALPQRIKVREAMRWFAAFHRSGPDPDQLIEQWGLGDRRNAHFAELSGGQRQRLFIALALVNEPEVVFLDEMTTGLDPAARRVTWDLIEAIRDRGTTVVLVTHFMDEAERLCDRVAVLDGGRIVALDTPLGLIAGHRAETTIRFSPGPRDISWLSRLPLVTSVARRDGDVRVRGTGSVLVDVAAALVGRGIRPADLRVEQPTLEDAFLHLTGHRAGQE